MKTLITFIIVVFSLTFINFATAQNNEYQADAGGTSVDKLDIGLNAGIGISQLTSGVLADADNKVRLNYQFSFRGMYFFTKHLGVVFDIGNHFFRTKVESTTSANYKEYNMQYIFIDFAPVFTFKNIYLHLGIYVGFIIHGSYEDETTSETNTSLFTVPDFGLCFGAGYIFDLGKGIKMLAGIEMKNQINNFEKTASSGSKIFAVFFNLGLLFNVK